MKSRHLLAVVTAATLGLAIGARADISTGVVAFWPLDEIDGTGPFTTPDYASSNTVFLMGNLSQTSTTIFLTNGPSAIFSNAFFFPPAQPTNYFTTAGTGTTPSGLPVFKSASGFTVSMWVKGAPQSSRYFYTESANAANQIFGFGSGISTAVAGKIDMFIRADNGGLLINHTNSIAIVLDNTWHHIAWTSTGGPLNANVTNQLYVDGNKDTNVVYKQAGVFSLTNITVGNLVRGTATALGAAFNGAIDNVGVWNRPLSQAEIQDFMTNSIPLPIVQSKPSISTISPDSTNALGEYVVLNVAAVGSLPIGYQWYLAGSPLANQTNTSLTNTTLTTPGTNVYSVVSSNFLGSITNIINVVIAPDPTNNLTNALVSYWPLDTVNTTSVTSTPDLYGRDDFLLLGTNGNLPTQIVGEFSQALNFDGTQFEAGRTTAGVPVFEATNYTVSLWVNGQPGSQLRVFSESSTNSATPLFTLATDPTGFLQTVSVLIRNDANQTMVNNLTSSLNAFDGNWHHIVWTDQNGHALLYIDGVLDPVSFSYTRTGTYTLNTTAIGAVVRAAGTTFPYSGGIDDVAIWNRRLTYSEIVALQTSTLPAPTQIIPPSISSFTFTPVDPTNNLFVGDTLSFNVQAGGTAPLAYQWLKNNMIIPNATNNVLTIPNAQVGDSGAYSLSISNGDPVLPGGMVITSAVVTATVQAFTPVTNGLALALDMDAVGSPNTQPGFQMFNLTLNGTAFTNGVKVTVTNVGTSTVLADRLRNVPPNDVVNGPGLTQAQLYNDFILSNVTNANTGLSITLERLAPGTSYGVTIWSYDASSLSTRISDWTELSSGTPIVIKTGYAFNGSVHPAADYDDTLGALLTSTAAGILKIQALNDPSNVNGVASFIDAIQLVANPKVTISSASIVADGNFQIIAQSQYPGEAVNLISSPDVTVPRSSWQPVANSVVTATHGAFTTFEVPPGATQQFFSAVATHP